MTSTAVQVSNGSNGAMRSGAQDKRTYSRVPSIIDIPNLIQVQLDSFEHFKAEGLRDLFNEISPIEDYPSGRFELSLGDQYLDRWEYDTEEEWEAALDRADRDGLQYYHFDLPKFSEEECRERESTYAAALHVTVKLTIKASGPGQGEIKQQKLFIGDIPMMTTTGTFIINGAERVVVSQLVRSPGVYFTATPDANTGRPLTAAKLIPYRGAWMEFETSNRDLLSVKVDRKRKTPISTLLRCLSYFYDNVDDVDDMAPRYRFESDAGLMSLFEDIDTDEEHSFMRTTIDKDPAKTPDDALLEFYRRLRPGEPPNVENAKTLMDSLFFNPRRYDLGRVGRYKLNRKLHPENPDDFREHTLSPDDIVALIRRMILINNGVLDKDDIDHLGNRRVRAVGELIQNQVRVGLLRMERVIKERMTTQMDPATTTPAALMNIRPVVASVREFFGGSQLSQFMDQTNPLAELTHKRRLSALGPGGLSRERAGFDVRDVHHSHYGRICPIETPEGPNIGLLGSLATYARTNEYGFIETPYRKVRTTISNQDPRLDGRTLTEDVVSDDGVTILKAGGTPTRSNGRLTQIAALSERLIRVKPYVSDDPDDIVYLTADEEESALIAPQPKEDDVLDERGQFIKDRVETRRGEDVPMESPDNVGYMDVAPIQLVSVSTALIPFLEHDDANRALMGSNMQRQAVPLLKPDRPLVGTGMEERVAKDSGQVVLSDVDGVVTSVTGDCVVVTDNEGQNHRFGLRNFVRSNQGTCVNQIPIVDRGDVVKAGDVLADSSSTEDGELALGQNVLVAFMSWEGYNFEDAIIISSRLLKDDKFTSIHIEKHEVESRDTKLGPEEITRDIPNVGDENLRNLDEEGIIRVGAEIGPGDILVGKITPKGETELSAEEKLLRAIFGEKARDVKDTSLRVPHGQRGKIIDVRVLSRDNKDELPPGVNKLVRLWVAQTRKITEGDKMAGRHGNKGVIARILPEEDMPRLEDGTPVDIILTPLGVPSRMNLGQVLETHLGWAASLLGFNAVTPVFDGARDTQIEDGLGKAWSVDALETVDQRSVDYKDRRIDYDKARRYVSELGHDHNALFDDDAPVGAARKVSLEMWLKGWFQKDGLVRKLSDVSVHDSASVDPTNYKGRGLDIEGMSERDILLEDSRFNREDQVAAPNIGKETLYDGRTGEKFDQPIAVGQIYMLKLIHLVEDKVHARSTGPYSLITQQPLGGKAQFGGQRFGEMEVWALEAYSAAYNLQEMLTVKSDDVVGRVKTYEAIVKGEDVIQPGIPESFHVLMKELQSLGLSVELLHEEPEGFGMGDFDDDMAEFPPFELVGELGDDELDAAPMAMPPMGGAIIDAETRIDYFGAPAPSDDD